MIDLLPRAVVDGRFANAHAWVGAEELASGNPRGALPHLVRSLRLKPAQPRVMTKLALSMLPPKAIPLMRAAKHGVRRYASRYPDPCRPRAHGKPVPDVPHRRGAAAGARRIADLRSLAPFG